MTSEPFGADTASLSLSRRAVEAGHVDLATEDSGERLGPLHPGDVLRYEFLEPLGATAHGLALALRVPANRISQILAHRRAVTAETALRLARHFGTTPQFWLALQTTYDLEHAEAELGARIRAEVIVRPAA
jgi:addiction module HigA family antidote